MKTRVNFLEGFPSGTSRSLSEWRWTMDERESKMSGTLLFRKTSLIRTARDQYRKRVDVAVGHKIYLALDISNDLSKSGRANLLNAPACCPCRERTVIWPLDSFSRFDSLMPFVGFLFSSPHDRRNFSRRRPHGLRFT